jgi:hypothetical protein
MTDRQPAPEQHPTPDVLRSDVATASGVARAWVDNAEHETDHTARQIVFAVSQGAADQPELRALLRDLATENERLAGDAVRLFSRYNATTRAATSAVETADPAAIAAAITDFHAIKNDGTATFTATRAVRQRLPREYGDPLKLDRDWPSTSGSQ